MPEPPLTHNPNNNRMPSHQTFTVSTADLKIDGPWFIALERDTRTGDPYMYMYSHTPAGIRLISYTTDKGPDLREMTTKRAANA